MWRNKGRMMKRHSKMLEIIPTFVLFFVFAVCMLITLLTGAKVYQDVSALMKEQYSTATCIQYITAKVRHYDGIGGISTGRLGDVDALIFWESYDEEDYVTYLYCYEEYLMELFCVADDIFLPGEGQRVMRLEEMTFEVNQDLLMIACKDGETATDTAIYVHTGWMVE